MGSQWILSLGAIGVIVCTILAAYGFRGRVTTVGVDLGTTYSVVGANINGKVVIFEDDKGRNIFPSIVSYRENGEILVAYDAIPYLTSDPSNTIFNAKRFIGKSLTSDDVRTYANHHPFRIVEANNQISNFSKIGFEISNHGRKIVPPESVGMQVLKHLKKIASKAMGHDQITKAVVAVPAKFTGEQRQATAEAYRLAGIKVSRIIEEPSAAAVAYGLHQRHQSHLMVYDLGGGTLDTTLLYTNVGNIQVMATDGDDSLGGSDFDICITDMIRKKIHALSQIYIPRDYVSPDNHDNPESYCDYSTIRKTSEQIKKSLSDQSSVPFHCKFNANHQMEEPSSSAEDLATSRLLSDVGQVKACTGHSHGHHSKSSSSSSSSSSSECREVSFQVDIQDFHQGCAHLFDRALAPVTRLLTELDMTAEDIDEVVLVGGSTRIPKIKQILREYFNKTLNDRIDPDITVAYGAAAIID